MKQTNVMARLLLAAVLMIGSATACMGQAQVDPQVQADILAGRKLPPIHSIPAPAEPNAIALYPSEKIEGPEEQWENYAGGPICRNVVRPTVTPFLPDPAQATGTAVIIAPGGGFMYLGMGNETFELARNFANMGVAAFVLKYRLSPTPRDSKQFLGGLFEMLGGAAANRAAGAAPQVVVVPDLAAQDAEAAVSLVRSRAAEWHIDPTRVGFIGFSAGAALAVKAAITSDAPKRPDFIGAMSGPTASMDVPAHAAPMFMAIALDDPLFAAETGGLMPAWRKAKRPVEAHFYENGGHGVGGPKQGNTSDLWFDQFQAWLKARKLLEPAK